MVIAVDVCVGHEGVRLLRAAGHTVIEAEHGESDRTWFARALAAGAEMVIAADSDIEILAYDHRVTFFRARNGVRGAHVAKAVLACYAADLGV